MAKYKVVTPKGASFTTAGGGYDLELEALIPIQPFGTGIRAPFVRNIIRFGPIGISASMRFPIASNSGVPGGIA